MKKDFQNMSFDELFKEIAQIENKINELNSQIRIYEGANSIIRFKIKDLTENRIEYLRTAILNIKVKVSAYKPTSIQERFCFKEEWKENFRKKLDSILKDMDTVLGNQHKISGFDILVSGKINKKAKKRPLYFIQLYNEIAEDFVNDARALQDIKNEKIENDAQLEELQKELQFLELEYFSIKLVILQRYQETTTTDLLLDEQSLAQESAPTLELMKEVTMFDGCLNVNETKK